MTRGAPGFFDVDERLAELSAKGDDLERLTALVDFELFRTALETAVPRADHSKGGRLPPKRPDLNGCVERAQSTWRYEFYATHDLPVRIDKLQAFVGAFAHRFNHHRPDDALGGQTPAEYLQTLGQGDPPPSHM